MNRLGVFWLGVSLASVTLAADPEPPRRLPPERPSRYFELQAYQASPGKLDALHARLRGQQIPLLDKHGVSTAGVFVPAGENPDSVVYLLVCAEDDSPFMSGWTNFVADPAWQKALADSDKDGKLVAQSAKSRFRATSWSPVLKPEESAKPRVFELRTYTCPDRGKHSALLKRFREHTMKLFAKHGMTNVVYWTPVDEPEASLNLVYLLAHESVDTAQKSFGAFRADPEWLVAKKASEDLAGGSLTNPEKGVVSQFLVPTEYSPLK